MLWKLMFDDVLQIFRKTQKNHSLLISYKNLNPPLYIYKSVDASVWLFNCIGFLDWIDLSC